MEWAKRYLHDGFEDVVWTVQLLHSPLFLPQFLFIPTWGKSSKHLDWENPLSMGSLLIRELSGQPLMEFWRHTLIGCQVCNWGISVPPVQYISRIVTVGGCLVVVAQWQSTGCTSQVSRVQFPATAGFFTLLYFCLITSKFLFIALL